MSRARIGICNHLLKLIEQDCYYITKGIRKAALCCIDNHPDYINEMNILVSKAYHMYWEPDVHDNLLDRQVFYFYVYKNPVTKILINIINGTKDYVIREYLTGLLLEYSDEDQQRHFVKTCDETARALIENHISEELQYSYLNMFDYKVEISAR